MELSLLKLQDPATERPIGERRRRIRHRLHSPVYASFNRPTAGMVLDLSELLDLNEDGFTVQASDRLDLNQIMSLSLDLPETKSHIHGTGQVVWSDASGRAGIRFSGLSDQSRRVLKEWLLINVLLGATKKTARPALVSPAAVPVAQPVVPVPIPDLTGMMSAVEDVRREVRAAADFSSALQLITERALSLTGASGAALAFLTDDEMVCRASAGEPALPLGTAVDVKQGITGECVRSGQMVLCADPETDSRVDREICRELGIGSILAAPIFSDFRVVGLLEVFAPSPRAFTDVHETALERLVELVPKTTPAAVAVQDAIVVIPELPVAESAPAVDSPVEAVWEPEAVVQEPLKGVPVRLTHILLLVLTAAVLALASGYLLAPRIEKLWFGKPVSASSVPPASSSVTQKTTFDELRKLAERGDASAQWMLGTRYHNGEGLPQDDAQAMRWFERAADQGYPDAQATSGAYYWAGRGVPKDLVKAYFWSTLALHQGDSSMESRLQGLALQMTTAQVATAQAQADEWIRRRAGK
jgi:putative methionine-R-sulfoxide reductase with GAF domain